MGKQRDGEDEDVVFQGLDRLSQLPQHIFQHVLSFLSQKEAVQTCVLSKSSRYLCSARPNVEFCENDFKSKREEFMYAVDRTIQGYYHDQSLRIERFCVEVDDWRSFSLLEKWIPKAVCALGVKTLELKIRKLYSAYFDLPAEFFLAHSLQNLHLQQCRWTIYGSVGENILFKHLRTLRLYYVMFDDGDFERTMSSCPLIEHVVLDNCGGLKTINFVNNHNFNLKYFKFDSYYMGIYRGKDVNIQIYTPSITTIIIDWCPNWYHRHLSYPNLKCLSLYCVGISQESFDDFSSNFPCLEELVIGCTGLEEFKLSSPSIKRLKIDNMEKLTKAAIDAPKLVLFEYESDVAAVASWRE